MMVAQDLVQAGEKKVGEFLSQVDDKAMRWAVLDQLVTSKGRAMASKEEILAMTDDFGLSAEDYEWTLQKIISQPDLFKEESLQSRITWLKESSGQADFKPYVYPLISGAYRDQHDELESWAASEADPKTQQIAYETLSMMFLFPPAKDLQKTAEYLSRIEDPIVQKKAFQNLQMRTNESARQELDQQLKAAGLDPDALKN